MHDGELDIDADQVRRLLADQFPQWAELSLRRVQSDGTDNAIFRLGDDLAVRLPRIDWATAQVEKEARWLPILAPHLPLAIPVPLAVGAPGHDYPWAWGVYPWLDGENATIDRLADAHQAATDLAAFINALRRIDITGGPLAAAHNFGRGVPLAARDAYTRTAIDGLRGVIDTQAALALWEDALRLPAWDRPPVWVHGDLQSGNLLALDGRLHAVIDFGALGVGDPACELIVAWNLFTPDSRETLRSALAVDDATWLRGRAWALSVGVVALVYYLHTNPGLAAISRYAIDQALADYRTGS
jgi:aminoglycoside phosphotransferase (APT) family kinase protein